MDDLQQQRARAISFRALHHTPPILVLPNAWDVASARVFEEAGFRAIGTSSAAIAASLGHPDGQRISRDEMLEVVARIAHAVRVPVSADMEAGYGTSPDEVAETARRVIEAGAVGMNLEDRTDDPLKPLADALLQMRRIKAIRDVAEASGVPLVLNARTDAYRGSEDEATRYAETVRRANAYREAGADCLFVMGVASGHTIERLVKAISGPVNVVAGAGAPPIPELERLGVARASLAAGPMRATLGLLQRIGRELQETGTYSTLLEGSLSYADMQHLFAR